MNNFLTDTACLDSQQFLGYIEGFAVSDDKNKVERHLCKCDLCLEIFISTFNLYLEDNTVH